MNDAMTPLELKEARISLGFSQEKLALELGVHRFTILRWEAGEHKVPRMLALALKQIKNERNGRDAGQREERERVKPQGETVRTQNAPVAGHKAKPARVIFVARGEMGAAGIEFSWASITIVTPEKRVTEGQESNHVSQRRTAPSGESSDGKKAGD